MRNSDAGALLRGASILSFARDRWKDVPPRCRHHVMSRLATHNKVLFLSPATSLRRALRTAFARDEGGYGLSQVSNQLFTFVPPRWLPSSHRPGLDAAFEKLRVLRIRQVLRKLRMSEVIAYVWHPAFIDLVDAFDPSLVVYHCYDDYAGFRGADAAKVADQERRLLDRADMAFAVSAGLHRRLSALHPNVHLVPNGVDDTLFAASAGPDLPVPHDIAHIPRPIIGCVTRVVPEYFDAALLRHVALARPGWSFLVVGPEERAHIPERDDLHALKQLPNVHFTGLRPLAELPAYLRAMDACVIPYRMRQNTQVANPLKVYEYLAAGKPVVSVPLELTDDVGAMVDMVSEPDQWIAAIDRALAADTPQKRWARRDVARANTWDRRVATISQLLLAAREAPGRHPGRG